jgi:hypothetical protein
MRARFALSTWGRASPQEEHEHRNALLEAGLDLAARDERHRRPTPNGFEVRARVSRICSRMSGAGMPPIPRRPSPLRWIPRRRARALPAAERRGEDRHLDPEITTEFRFHHRALLRSGILPESLNRA